MAFRLIAHPPFTPAPGDNSGFFIFSHDIPASAETGEYSIPLVILSYVIVTLAAYVALTIARRLAHGGNRSQRIKIVCGALAMGAGIWSMHFIGMLSYKMRMLLTYNPWITALSMVVAVVFAGAAFWVIRGKNLSNRRIIYAAPLLGVAVCGMHYIGMQAMQMDAELLYMPGLFILSFVIATTAAAAALKMMFHARGSRYHVLYNVIAAMTMGVAVCGMHYTGMAASVFLPYADCRYVSDQDFSWLVTAVTLITLLIIFVAFLAKLLDEALVETELRTAQLFQAQKMESVGQLTGGIAHDFNNVLNVILGTFRLLAALPSLPDEADKFIKTGMQSAERAEELAKRLLAFSRNEIVEPVIVRLSAVLPIAIDLAQRAMPPNVTIIADIPPQLSSVKVDPVHFESAVLNLMLNARDAMPEGGTITVRAGHENAAAVEGLSLPRGEYLTVRVEDTGLGMDEEVMQRAREPFFTTKDVGKGSGMGLSMVSGFARRSGGDITIRSAVGQGTTVTIYLPVCAEPPAIR